MYVVLLTIALLTGYHHTTKHTCPDLVCVAYLMVAGNESGRLERVRVLRARDAEGFLPGSGQRTIFPPVLDLRFQ